MSEGVSFQENDNCINELFLIFFNIEIAILLHDVFPQITEMKIYRNNSLPQ